MEDEKVVAKTGWFGWLFGACSGSSAAISGVYSKLTTREPKEREACSLSIDETIKTNNVLMKKFDMERQAWIEGAKKLRNMAVEQARRAKDVKLNEADRAAASGNARLFTKRYKKAMIKANALQKQFENLESANETLESGQSNEQYLRAMQANTVVMRKTANDSGLTADAVGEIMDDFAEQLGEAQTLTREVSRSIVDTPDEMDFDDVDAAQLLDEWLKADEVQEAEDIAKALDRVPNVGGGIPSANPTPNPPQQQVSGIGTGPRRIRRGSPARVAIESGN